MNLDKHIIQLIYQCDITTQSELVARLDSRGIRVNQSTLSRRLKRMGVEKVDGVYAISESGNDNPWRITDVPPNLIVIHTPTSFAQPVAYRIDTQHIEGIAGTVAGDDTILLAHTLADTAELIQRLEKVLDEAKGM